MLQGVLLSMLLGPCVCCTCDRGKDGPTERTYGGACLNSSDEPFLLCTAYTELITPSARCWNCQLRASSPNSCVAAGTV